MLKVEIDSFTLCKWFQGITIFLNWEHSSCRCIPMHINITSDSILSPSFLTEIHYLLWSSSTFDWHCWKSKDSFTTFEILSKITHLMCIVKSIHASNWTFFVVKSILRPFNKIISELNSRAHDQVIVCHWTFVIINIKSVVIWVQFTDSLLKPVQFLIETISSISHQALFFLGTIPDTSCDISISWLIMMHLFRVNDSNIFWFKSSRINELRRNRISCWSTTYDGNTGVNSNFRSGCK
jgi:hypothetical protein